MYALLLYREALDTDDLSNVMPDRELWQIFGPFDSEGLAEAYWRKHHIERQYDIWDMSWPWDKSSPK